MGGEKGEKDMTLREWRDKYEKSDVVPDGASLQSFEGDGRGHQVVINRKDLQTEAERELQDVSDYYINGYRTDMFVLSSKSEFEECPLTTGKPAIAAVS